MSQAQDMDVEELRALLSLRAAPGLGDVGRNALLLRHATAVQALRTLEREQPHIAVRLNARPVQGWLDHALRAVHGTADLTLLRIGDAAYPARLTDLTDPPTLLFLRGDARLLDRLMVAVVGTRASSEYGADVARAVAATLAGAGVVVVSGLAHGIDRVAHEATLEAGGLTVAVVGCGMDVSYPPQQERLQERIAREGLLVTEFLPGTPALAHHFPQRNRIIAALASVVVVVEAPRKSGALITADHALELGREILAVPGPIGRRTSEGTNALIRDGATILLDPADVLTAAQATALSPSAPSSAFPATRSRTTPGVSDSTSSPDAEGNDLPLTDGRAEHQAVTDRSSPYSPECAAVLGALGPEPAHVDDVARAAQVAPAEALAALLQLELTGRVRQAAGLRFSRPERAASIG